MSRPTHPLDIPEILIRIGHHIPLWTQIYPPRLDYLDPTTTSSCSNNDNFSFIHYSTYNVAFTPKTLVTCTQVSKHWRHILLPLLWSRYEAPFFYPDPKVVLYKGKGLDQRERPTKNMVRAQTSFQKFREQAEEVAKRRKELARNEVKKNCGLLRRKELARNEVKKNCGLLRSARIVDAWEECVLPIMEGLVVEEKEEKEEEEEEKEEGGEEESYRHRHGLCVNLTDLTLLGSSVIRMRVPTPGPLLVRANPRLQRLDWTAGYSFSNRTLDARHFVGLIWLQSLRLELWTSPPGVLIQVLRAVARSLRELVLGHVMDFDVVDFDVVAEGVEGQGEGEGVGWVMPRLELLSLQSCRPSPMVYLTELVKHCPNLRILWTSLEKKSGNTNVETTSRLADSLRRYCPRFCSLRLGYDAPWQVIEPLVRHSFTPLPPLTATTTTTATAKATIATTNQGGLRLLNLQITNGSDFDIVSSILLHAVTMEDLSLIPFLGNETDLTAYQTLLAGCVSLKRFKFTVYRASYTERVNQMQDEFLEQFFCGNWNGKGDGKENGERWGSWKTLEVLQFEGGVSSRDCRRCGGGRCNALAGHGLGGGRGTEKNDGGQGEQGQQQQVQQEQQEQQDAEDTKDAGEAIRGLLGRRCTFLGWSLAEYQTMHLEWIAKKMDWNKLKQAMEAVQRQGFERLGTLILDGVVFRRPIRCREGKQV